MKKKPKLLLPATLPEGATDEQRQKLAKERLILTIVKTVYAVLMLLITVLALFVPCYSYTVKPLYTQDHDVKYSLSALDTLTFMASSSSVQKEELNFVKNIGEVGYIQPDSTRSYKERTAPSNDQVMREIEYRKSVDLDIVEKISNVYRFVRAMNQNIDDYIKTLIGISNEMRGEYYDAGKKLIGYLLDNFRDEIERRNFSGLHFFMRSASDDMTSADIGEAADKYLLNKYSSMQELPDGCAGVISCIPYYYESFSLTSEEGNTTLTVTVGDEKRIIVSYYDAFTASITIATIFACIFVLLNLIYLIFTTISVVKMFVKKDYSFKQSSFNLMMPCFIVLFLLTQLFSMGEIILSAVSVGAIFIMIFSVMTIVAQSIYNKRFVKAKERFFDNEISSDMTSIGTETE